MSRKPRGARSVPHDPFAIAYLNVVMEEADQEELVAALSRVARTSGRSRVVESRLLEKIELNAQSLYRALCLRANPELRSALALLRALGVRLAMQPIAAAHDFSAHDHVEAGAVRRRSAGTDLAVSVTEA
jgi:probable addiction module antidote protein